MCVCVHVASTEGYLQTFKDFWMVVRTKTEMGYEKIQRSVGTFNCQSLVEMIDFEAQIVKEMWSIMRIGPGLYMILVNATWDDSEVSEAKDVKECGEKLLK